MRSTMNVAAALFAGLIMAVSARTAAADPCAGVVCNNTTVQRLSPAADVSNPKVLVRPTDGGQQALNCTPVGGVFLTLKASHPLFSETYAALLEATVNNRKVSFRIVTGSPDCEIAFAVLENP